jgi:hypothetical protein
MLGLGKVLLVAGTAVFLLGLLGERIPLVGRLPGDIRIEREGATFYFPLGTCAALSVVLTVVVNLVVRLLGRRP